jgi:chromosome segregation ATPase
MIYSMTNDEIVEHIEAMGNQINDLEAKLEQAEEKEVKAHRQGYEQARAACTEFTRALVERIKSLEAEQNRLSQQCEGLAQAASNNGQALIISESKLAKAVETLNALDATLDRNGWHVASIAREGIRITLAEIKGTSHE